MLLSLGYSLAETCATDDDCRGADPETAAGIGNLAAQAVIDARRHDGSNQYGDLPTGPVPGVPARRAAAVAAALRGWRPMDRRPRIPSGPAPIPTTWRTAIRRTSRSTR